MQVTIRKVKNNKALPILPYEGRFYAVAPEKGAYEIELFNNCSRRRLAVVSVDGLSVMDGKPASMKDDGYLLNAYQRMSIRGWRRNNDEVARFEFTPNEASYSEQMGHGKRNTGVIGVAVFEEANAWQQPIHIINTWYSQPFVWPQPNHFYWQEHVTCTAQDPSLVSGRLSAAEMSTASFTPRGIVRTSASLGGETPDGQRFCSVEPEIKTCGGLDVNCSTAAPSVDLGTGYGERATMRVRHVNFTRASETPQVVIVIEYATKERLLERGIPVDRAETAVEQPNPFPQADCPAPSGWRG